MQTNGIEWLESSGQTLSAGRHTAPIWNPIELADGPIIPIGVPIGSQPSREFCVRRDCAFCMLNEIETTTWIASWRLATRESLNFAVADANHWHPAKVARAIDTLLANSLLIDLAARSGTGANIIGELRPIPRASAIGWSPGPPPGFDIVPPAGGGVVRLSAAQYTLWSAWDGASSVQAAAQALAVGLGIRRELADQLSLQLVVLALRYELAFLDIEHGGGRIA